MDWDGWIPNPRRPIDVWPPQTFRGRRGFSARHYERVTGGRDDPLRTAARLADARIQEEIGEETASRLQRGDDVGAVLRWQEEQSRRRRAESWERLSSSFDAVIDELSQCETKVCKMMLREARAKGRLANPSYYEVRLPGTGLVRLGREGAGPNWLATWVPVPGHSVPHVQRRFSSEEDAAAWAQLLADTPVAERHEVAL